MKSLGACDVKTTRGGGHLKPAQRGGDDRSTTEETPRPRGSKGAMDVMGTRYWCEARFPVCTPC